MTAMMVVLPKWLLVPVIDMNIESNDSVSEERSINNAMYAQFWKHSVKNRQSSNPIDYTEDSFYRYSKLRLNQDITASHLFLVRELRNVLASSSSKSLSKPENHDEERSHQRKPSQLIIGRFGTSESEIMEHAIATSTLINFAALSTPITNTTTTGTTKPIPSNFYTPGYYFTSETTLVERCATLQQWGWQRIRSYSYMNLFAILDWSHINDDNSSMSSISDKLQMRGIESYAPKSGYIHASTIMYPPCFLFLLSQYNGIQIDTHTITLQKQSSIVARFVGRN